MQLAPMQDIKAWLLNSGSFEEGVALYEKYGDNTFLKRIFKKQGPTPFNLEKLSAELESLAPAAPATTDTNPQIIENDVQPAPDPEQADPRQVNPKDFTRYLSLKEVIKTKYRQIDHNMAALALSPDKTIRFITAKQILSLHDQITDAYILVDYYDQYQQFPDHQGKVKEPLPKEKELQALWVSNCKAKTRLESGSCRNITKTENLIKANNLRIAELRGRDQS